MIMIIVVVIIIIIIWKKRGLKIKMYAAIQKRSASLNTLNFDPLEKQTIFC